MLKQTIVEIKQCLMVHLNDCLIKKRVPLGGKGKRSGARLIIAYQVQGHLFILYGYKKSEQINITDAEREILTNVGNMLFDLDEEQIKISIIGKKLMELKYEEI